MTAKDARPATTDRVEHIEQLMASGLYRPGMTAAALATKWGLARQTVENLACEASRNIRREIGRSEDIRTRMISTLHTIVAESVRTKKYRDAIEAIRVMTGVVDSDERSTLEEFARNNHVAGNAPTRFIVEVVSPERPKAEPEDGAVAVQAGGAET